jgi:CheY-like chemotaxis protein
MLKSLKQLLMRTATAPALPVDESGALFALSRLMGMGVLGLLFYALQTPATFFATFTTSVMLAGAVLIVGGLIGFLFGIPRTLQNELPNQNPDRLNDTGPAVAYQANTNLEQISDWLTKILVGVGLTQLANLWTGLKAAAELIQAGLGSGPSAHAMALAILIYFPVGGFLFGYLWTRLFLAGAFRKADLAVLLRKAEEKAIIEVAETLEPVSSGANARGAASEEAATAPSATAGKLRGLWVDDLPSNNTSLKQSFEKILGLTFELSLSTEDALQKIQSTPYAVIISDMSRPPDHRAGYTLLDQLHAAGITIPFIIYASRGGEPDKRAEAQQHKAFGITNSPQELLQLLRQALQPSRS